MEVIILGNEVIMDKDMGLVNKFDKRVQNYKDCEEIIN